MKTKITIVIESPDKIEVYPEEGQTKEDFNDDEHLEEMIKDQFDITKVKWDDKGNIIIDVDMDKLTEVKVVKEKQVEIIPIYKERYVRRDVYPYPYWRPNLITCKTTPQRQTLSYCKG